MCRITAIVGILLRMKLCPGTTDGRQCRRGSSGRQAKLKANAVRCGWCQRHQYFVDRATQPESNEKTAAQQAAERLVTGLPAPPVEPWVAETTRIEAQHSKRISAAYAMLPDDLPELWATEVNRQADNVYQAVENAAKGKLLESYVAQQVELLEAMCQRIADRLA